MRRRSGNVSSAALAFAGLAAVDDAHGGAVNGGDGEGGVDLFAAFASGIAVGEDAEGVAHAVIDAHFAAGGVAVGICSAIRRNAGRGAVGEVAVGVIGAGR